MMEVETIIEHGKSSKLLDLHQEDIEWITKENKKEDPRRELKKLEIIHEGGQHRLKAKGHDVTLIEKHSDLGGRASVFRRNGFIYDGGPTVITAPYLINELFELFKKNPNDYIKLTPLKIWYQFIFEDKTSFNYSGDEKEMSSQIEKINKVGYCHIHENGKNIIRPALITVYKYKKESINE